MALKTEVTANSPGVHRIPLRLSLGCRPGTWLRIRANQLRTHIAFQTERVLIGEQPVHLVEAYRSHQSRDQWFPYFNRLKTLAAWQQEEGLPNGSEVIIEVRLNGGEAAIGLPDIGPDAFECYGAVYTGMDFRFELVTAESLEAEPEDWTPASEPTEIDIVPGPTVHLVAWRQPDGGAAVQWLDQALNPVPKKQCRVAAHRELHAAPDGTCCLYLPPVDDPSSFPVVDNEGREGRASPLPRAIDGTPIWFGEFHWHTSFSGDGGGDLFRAMASARDKLALAFAGPADHLDWGATYQKTGRHHTEHRKICEPFTENGRFVAIPTFELSGREGHVNVIAESWDVLAEVAEGLEKAQLDAFGDRLPLPELVELCPRGKTILVPHHSNMSSASREKLWQGTGRPVWCPFDWGSEPYPDHLRLAEIIQTRGSFEAETPDPSWRIDVGGFGASLQSALARGFRIGFTGGTDNHCGWPTRGQHGWAGITGLMCPELTPEAVFEAFYERRTYATTGPRMVGDFQLGDWKMGSEATLGPDEDRKLRIKLFGTDAWEAVQVVSNGSVIADLVGKEPVAPEFETEWCDERPGRPLRNTYYYIRARQSDGHCLWLSPIWLDLPPA
jgi:hypothetical protein